MKSNIFYNKDFWEDCALLLMSKWVKLDKLPYQSSHYKIKYRQIGCTYDWDGYGGQFSSFCYRNDWSNYDMSAREIDDNYAYFYGPFISLKEALPYIWDDLNESDKVELMSSVLGSKDE